MWKKDEDTVITETANYTVYGQAEVTVKSNQSTTVTFSKPEQYARVIPNAGTFLYDFALAESTGLTISTKVTFTKLVENTFILAKGDLTKKEQSFFLVFKFGKLHAGLSYKEKSWFVTIERSAALSVEYTFDFSFSLTSGFKVYMNNAVVGETTVSVVNTVTSESAVEDRSLYIARHKIVESVQVDMTFSTVDFFTATRKALVQGKLLPAGMKDVILYYY